MNKKLMWLIMLVMVACTLYSALGHSYRPVHYYELEGDGEDTGNQYLDRKLSFYNGVTFPDGKIGKGASFDGLTQYADNQSMGDFSNVSTLDFWVNFTGAFDSTDYFLTMYEADASDYLYMTVRAETKGQLLYEGPACGIPNCIEADWESGTLTDQKWYHMVITTNASGTYHFIDGALEWSDADAMTLEDEFVEFTLGRRGYYDSSPTSMVIDNLAMFYENYTLADVIWSYNTGTGRNFSGATAPPTPNNITITANSSNGTVINIFNITINGTFFSTTTGSIVSDIEIGKNVSITINAEGLHSNTTNPINDSTSFNLTPIRFSNVTFRLFTPPQNRTDISIMGVCYATSNTSLGTNVSYNVSNVNDTWFNYTVNNTGSHNVTLNTWDFFDRIEASCEICNEYLCENSSIGFIAENTLDTVITLNAVNTWGVLLGSARMEFDNGTNFTSNPVTTFMSLFLNSTNKTVLTGVNVSDLTYFNRDRYFNFNITENTTSYNLELDPNQLVLNFYQQGVTKNTEGWIADQNKSRNFTNTSLVVVQQNLSQGYIHVRFGLTNWSNHTQFYEYINDWENHTAENLEVLSSANWYAYLKVIDYTNSPIKDATVRISTSIHNEYGGNWSYHTLIGQRLTTDDGYTFFWADSNSEVLITVYKTGYEPQTILLTIGDESFTRAEPFVVQLRPVDNAVIGNAWLYINKEFLNRSKDMSGTIFAPEPDKVEITTLYRNNTAGLQPYDISSTEDSHHRFDFNLISGTDFSATGTDNITLMVYFNDELWNTYQLRHRTNTTIFGDNITDTLEKKFLNPILFIALILLSFGIGMMFKDKEIAPTVFKIGGIFIATISASYWTMAIIIMVGWAGITLRKIISE